MMTLRMPANIQFGSGALRLVGQVASECNVRRPLVVTDTGVHAAGIADRVRSELNVAGLPAGLWAGAESDPDRYHVERCRDALMAGEHDAVVAVGGGSVIDVAKAAAVLFTSGSSLTDCYGLNRVTRPGLPVIAVPTTAGSGAEVSSHAVIVEPTRRKKEVVSGPPVMARAVVVDPALTATVPREHLIYCALDGLIHALEAFVARAATPGTDLYVCAAIPRIVRALPTVLRSPADVSAREELSLGCLFAGVGMANANAGVIHALGYPLTSEYGIPHGMANALMAPAALHHSWPGAPERYARASQLLCDGLQLPGSAAGAPALAGLMAQFLREVGVLSGAAAWGVQEADLERLAELAGAFRPVIENTPYRVLPEDLLAMYRTAWQGDLPAS